MLLSTFKFKVAVSTFPTSRPMAVPNLEFTASNEAKVPSQSANALQQKIIPRMKF